jgi:hypothetical protein
MTPKREKLPPYYEPTYRGRPLQYVEDLEGNCWLCDKRVGPWSDHVAKGCWRCEHVAFPAGGR